MDLKESKNELRKNILNLLKQQKEEDRIAKSSVISEKLFARKEFQEARVIMFYASTKGEVETFPMMEEAQKLGKQIALPRILDDQKIIFPYYVNNLKKDLVPGPYDIQQPCHIQTQPVDVTQLDLVITPGVAFDHADNRLGRGAGYYDRFFDHISSDVIRIGLAFDFQIVQKIPHEQHDLPVSYVITN